MRPGGVEAAAAAALLPFAVGPLVAASAAVAGPGAGARGTCT